MHELGKSKRFEVKFKIISLGHVFKLGYHFIFVSENLAHQWGKAKPTTWAKIRCPNCKPAGWVLHFTHSYPEEINYWRFKKENNNWRASNAIILILEKSMNTKIISLDDIRKIVKHKGLDGLMDEMIDQLTHAFTNFSDEETNVHPRDGFKYTNPTVGLVEWMPSMKIGERATIKIVGYHPFNPSFMNLPTIISTVSIYDTHSGHLIGMMDGTYLTALRTGAASGLASKVLAAPNSEVIGLIGCGAQAITQLHAISRVFNVKEVLVYDNDPSAKNSFRSRAAFMGLHIREIKDDSMDEFIQSCDIISTATSVGVGEGPVFKDTETKPWLHINAVGSDFPGKVEVPESLLKRSFVCPEFLEQAVKEGECQQLSPKDIGASLVELLRDPDEYDHLKQQPTVFDSTGWALEDQVAMEMLFNYAIELGLGTNMEIESITVDPKNPYNLDTPKNG